VQGIVHLGVLGIFIVGLIIGHLLPDVLRNFFGWNFAHTLWFQALILGFVVGLMLHWYLDATQAMIYNAEWYGDKVLNLFTQPKTWEEMWRQMWL